MFFVLVKRDVLVHRAVQQQLDGVVWSHPIHARYFGGVLCIDLNEEEWPSPLLNYWW